MATVKLQLNNDIRRVVLTKEQLEYKKLRKIIQRKYQSLSSEFVLKYQDEEGDLVTIASNQDFQEALNQASPLRLLRIIVSPNSPIRNPIAEALPQVQATISDILSNAFASFSLPKSVESSVPLNIPKDDFQTMELDVSFEDGYRILNQQAIANMTSGNYVIAEQLLKQMISIIPKAPIAYYNLACTYALQNLIEPALQALEVAFENGYSNYAHVNSDSDFDKIRNDPRFIAVVQRIAPEPLVQPRESSEASREMKDEKPLEIVSEMEVVKVEPPKESENIVQKQEEIVVEPPMEKPVEPFMQASQIIIPAEPTAFEQALDQLNDMGFTDHERNVNLLINNNLDLLATVRCLLGL